MSSKQCLIGIQNMDGREPGSPRSAPRSRGSRSLRSAPRRQVLFVITGKYKGPSAKMHKTIQKKIKNTATPTLARRL